MQFVTTLRACAFCGTQGDQDTRYAAGFGVLMCEDCLEFFHKTLNGAPGAEPDRDPQGLAQPMRRHSVEDLSNQEMLDTLPRIASTAAQANRFMADWVEQIRERKLSWTAVGNAMGVSRQAAWERFTRVLGTERNPTPR